MRLAQSNCQTENEQNVTHDVEEIVEPPATLALHEFRTRDLAIASVENAEDLEKNESPDKRPIVSLCEHERRHHWDRKNEPGPSVRRGRKSEEQSSDRARNRTIEMARNETVLRFAASAQKLLFDVVNLFAVRDVVPRSGACWFPQFRRPGIIFPRGRLWNGRRNRLLEQDSN